MEGKTPNGTMLPGSDGYLKTLPTLKHFAANNSEYNRLNGDSDMDQRTLREYYTEQFRDLVQQSGPAAIMSSYNEVNGVPAAANVQLIDELARETFGFQGYFTSDCDAVYEIQAGHHWQPPGAAAPLDAVGRTAYANSAGEDLDCNQGYHDGSNYANTVPTAVGQHIQTQTGVYNENDVDVSLVRLFTARIETGEFDNETSVPWVAAARARLAPGTWVNSDANNAVTETPARLAMARRSGDQSIVLLKNDAVKQKDGGTGKLLPLKVPSSGAFKVAVIGYYANPSSMFLGGYASRQGAPGVAKEVNGYNGLKTAVQQIDPDATVDYYPGVTPGTLDSVDAASVKAAADYDAVIVYAGTDASTSAEAKDRTSVALPGAQAQMISQVAAANPNTVVYMETVGEVDVTSFQNQVPALLWSSYNGQRKGESLADVVLGAYNPSGRLPFTWYQDVNKLPAIGDYTIRPTAADPGRTYMYYSGPVSYPFGHGLSYTDFRYSHLRVSSRNLDANGTLRVSADVTDTGSTAGDEVAQVYVTTPDAPAALQRPIKRLEGFTKVSLRPHQTKHVTFTIEVPKLAFFSDDANRFKVDDGRYGIQLSTSSADADIQAQTFVRVSGELRPTPMTVTARAVAAGDAAQGTSQRVYFPGPRRHRPAAHRGDERRHPLRLHRQGVEHRPAGGHEGALPQQPTECRRGRPVGHRPHRRKPASRPSPRPSTTTASTPPPGSWSTCSDPVRRSRGRYTVEDGHRAGNGVDGFGGTVPHRPSPAGGRQGRSQFFGSAEPTVTTDLMWRGSAPASSAARCRRARSGR